MMKLVRLAGLALSVAAVGSLAVPIDAADARGRKRARKSSSSKAYAASSGGGFRSCAQARAAGAAPVRSGDAGYSRRIDRDGDGVACER